MAATVSNGLTNITLANNNTGFNTVKLHGTGGTPSEISETDVYLQGTGACSVKVSNQGIVLAYNISAGVDLSATGTHVYIWANMLAGPLMNDINNGSSEPGLGIYVSSNSSLDPANNYRIYPVDGASTYPGGWKRYVIDLDKSAPITSGTYNRSSTTWIGMYCRTNATAKFDNLVLDRIDYGVAGTGLSVYGTSTTDDTFGDILAADEGNVSNKYGIVTSREGVVYVQGTIELGDDASTNACNLTDIDKVIVFETPYYYNGSSIVNSVSDTFHNLKIVGNGTGDTTVQFGKKVGTGDSASGRNGLTIIEGDSPVTIDFDDGSAENVLIYGSTFQNITGGLTWGTDTSHECIGNNFSGCTQFNPGSVILRACNFINTSSTDGAMLWNTNINIQKSGFFANTTGPGIEHDTWNGIESGTATATDGTGVTLTDSAATFTGGNVSVNDIVYNETTGGYGTVTTITDATHLDCSAGLSTGGWTSGDAYSIATPITYSDLNFSGNTNDIDNSTSPANVVAISKTGTSNPSTFPSGDFVVIQGSVTVKVTVVDSSNSPIQNVQTSVHLSSNNAEILNGDTNASGIISASYAGTTPATVYIRTRKSSTGATKYRSFSTTATIASGTGLDTTIVLTEDGIAN